MKDNLETYILPLITEYRDVCFHFIFPPYHAMYWETFEAKNIADIMLESEEYLLTTLISYDNVKVHFFSLEESVIYDFENYVDTAHYKSSINELMVKGIGREDHVLKQEDIPDVMARLRKMLEEYDYHTVLRLDM